MQNIAVKKSNKNKKALTLFPPLDPDLNKLPIKVYELREMINKLSLYIKGSKDEKFKTYIGAIRGLAKLEEMERTEFKNERQTGNEKPIHLF